MGAKERKATPPPWAKRFKIEIKTLGLNLATVAERMKLSEPTLRSWTNGTRDANITDFFALCTAAGVDPEIVLFGDQPTKEGVSKWALQLATKIDAIKETKNGQAALTLIENTFATTPAHDDEVIKAFKTNERPKIGGVISRPTLFNDDFTGPRKGE